MSVLDGPGEGTWSAFAMKVVEERDAAREALANSDACWRMEQEFLQRKLAGEAAHIKSLEGLLVDAARERDEARTTLAFLQAEYGKAEDETLTRDALELKIRLLEQQLSAIRKAVYDLRVLRSSCEDSYDGEFRVHLIEDQYNALIKLASE